MSTQLTGTPLHPTSSINLKMQTTVPQGSGSQHVEFYLAAVWTWTDSGRKRLHNFVESLNVDRPTYIFDPELQAVKVRCPRDSEVYIRRKFFQFVQDIENEYLQSGQITDVVQQDGTLKEPGHHPDVTLPVFLPNTRRLPIEQAFNSDTSGSIGGDGSQTSDPTMSLVVPDELRNGTHVVAWQDLQGKNKNFEGTCFLSPAAQAAVESAHDVQIIIDNAQKVIFIGTSASLDVAKKVKARLTRLLRHHQNSRKLPSIFHHVFYVESPTVWTIDTREITQINPVLAPPTIFDPWKYPVPEQYGLFHDDAGVFALRVCLEEPLRNGQRNTNWSLFGPRAKNVFNGRPAKRSSRFFDGIKAARHLRGLRGRPPGAEVIGSWLQELTIPLTVKGAMISTFEMAGGTQTPIQSIGEDDPIPLDFDPSKRLDATISAPEPCLVRSSNGNGAAQPQPTSLLDQQDAVLRDPCSTLQRAMKPSQRLITVPDPDSTEIEPPLQCIPSSQLSVNQPSRASNGVNAQSSTQKEFSIFKNSVGHLLERMRGQYGLISLRAELGRYYAYAVPESGRAVNQQNEPARGWEPNKLRREMEVHQSFIFTKALTSWGNDIDFLAARQWEPVSRAVFFDFYFQATLSNVSLDMILEVDAEEYTWKLRFLDNIEDVIHVHCLSQHWDFQVALTHDRVLEYQHHWAKFAEALIESLDVKAPELEFQHTFSEAAITGNESPIIIGDVRARQVCRFQHQNKKTYLDISRILPTKIITSRDPMYRKVRGVLTKSSVDDPGAGDNPMTGEFAQWFEASVSSVRLEELLQQNQVLIPGDVVDWSVEQVEQEKLLTDIYQQAAEVVKTMNGVGVECNNGHQLRKPKTDPKVDYQW